MYSIWVGLLQQQLPIILRWVHWLSLTAWVSISWCWLPRRKTRIAVNIDLWNYWHFAFAGAVAYFVMGQSLLWGYFAAIVCYIITLICADLTAERNSRNIMIWMVSLFLSLSARVLCLWLSVSTNFWIWFQGFSKLDIDAEGLKKKFGVLGEPLVLGVIIGTLIGWAALAVLRRYCS